MTLREVAFFFPPRDGTWPSEVRQKLQSLVGLSAFLGAWLRSWCSGGSGLTLGKAPCGNVDIKGLVTLSWEPSNLPATVPRGIHTGSTYQRAPSGLDSQPSSPVEYLPPRGAGPSWRKPLPQTPAVPQPPKQNSVQKLGDTSKPPAPCNPSLVWGTWL